MQTTYTRFLMPGALLLALVVGQLDSSAAQDAATLVAEIGANAVSTAAATSSLTSSISDVLVQINPVGSRLLEAVQQIKAQADANAAANDDLNAKLRALLDSAQSFTETDDDAASVFNGIRKLRTEGDH
ncbi:hypothetical protein PHYPSEUDO_000854 [Phytophthora pseudosyringae]|uniref:RxLR effector protein n=1 Tax=Phytophthora pseudosyringae TaxID=221518 RepID=A0A8T1W1N4_9STRA|nr:hypothetical protein PHYPSEUDO_000854 [Phytophthora pseudosyringae]